MNQSLTQPNLTRHVDEDVDYGYIIACGYVFVQTAICAIGFLLNLINFAVFVQPAFTAPTYIMMMFLSLADAVTLGFRIPQGYVFLPGVSSYNSDAVLYVYVYTTYIEVPFTNMSENVSAWLTVALAIERYVTMKHWQIAKRYITPQNTRRLVLIIFVVAVIFNTPYFATQTITLTRENGTLDLKSELTSFYHTSYYAACTYLRIVLVQIIPLCFLCVSNCLLFALVSQHNQRFSRHQNAKSTEKPVKKRRSMFQKKSVNGSFKNTVSTFEPTGNSTQSWVLIRRNNSQASAQNPMAHTNGERLRPSLVTAESLETRASPAIDNDNCIVPLTDNEQPRPKQPDNSRQPSAVISQQEMSGVRNSQSIGGPLKVDRSQKRRTAQKKLTILLIAVILLFLIGQVPQSLAYIRVFATLGICSTNHFEQCIVHQFYRMITINLSHLAFALTFFVYLFLNRDFRNTLVKCACTQSSCLRRGQ